MLGFHNYRWLELPHGLFFCRFAVRYIRNEDLPFPGFAEGKIVCQEYFLWQEAKIESVRDIPRRFQLSQE